MRLAVISAVVIVVAAAAVVAIQYGLRRVDSVVAETVERYGRAVTGTEVDVDGVDVSLSAGRAEISDITIDNPDGYDTDYAVHVDRAAVVLAVASLAADVPVVEELTIDGAIIQAEQRAAATNLSDIQRHATAAPAEQPPAEAAQPGRIIVDRFRVTNARVLLTSEYLAEPEELPLHDIIVQHIGRGSGGATYADAATAMLTPLLAAARDAASERFRAAAAAAARGKLDEEAGELRERVEQRIDELRDRDDGAR
jgi:uncharacterized protein involved in outer membrane biogenesis